MSEFPELFIELALQLSYFKPIKYPLLNNVIS